MGSHEAVAGIKAMSTLKIGKWHPLVPFSPPNIYHTKQLNPIWSNSSKASHVVNSSCLPACHWEMEPFKEHPSNHDKPQKQATSKAAWSIISTNTWLNCQLMCTLYRLMVKSVSCCCVTICAYCSFKHLMQDGFLVNISFGYAYTFYHSGIMFSILWYAFSQYYVYMQLLVSLYM